MFFFSTTGATFFLPVPVAVLSYSGSPAGGTLSVSYRSTLFFV